MDQDWARLARAIRRAREGRLMGNGAHMTQQDLATAAGVSESTVQNLEDENRTYTRRPVTLPRIEAALGWGPGSADLVLAGGDPVAPQPTGTSDPDLPKVTGTSRRLPLRVQHELEDGEIIDTEVIDLSRGGMKMVVVVTRDPGVSDDELRADFAEWSRVQRRLRGITSGDESSDS
ncbi:helix-turn-helix domain-containing protein [Actinacidiphila glaucinigra]|uniref:helix-turn-helix transcriptional regulator n=1 Tax=Actinacidiphila glaucinigra TaxID=235986 RepID=UPI00325242CB